MRVRFLSGNEHKIKEAVTILGSVGVSVVPIAVKLSELQTDNIDSIVSDKAAKAFHKIGHPLFVEQTGLFIDRLNGFPGGLTQVFWDTVGPDRVTEIFGQGSDTGVIARTYIGYCDGRSIHKFQGEIRGNIAPSPRGSKDFQWDCIFVPEGDSETFAEMGDRKNDISMRRLALSKLSVHLGGK